MKRLGACRLDDSILSIGGHTRTNESTQLQTTNHRRSDVFLDNEMMFCFFSSTVIKVTYTTPQEKKAQYLCVTYTVERHACAAINILWCEARKGKNAMSASKSYPTESSLLFDWMTFEKTDPASRWRMHCIPTIGRRSN